MKVHANVQIKDEEILLQEIAPIWKGYPIDKWVFYDDNSTDNTVEIIKDFFGEKAVILNDKLPKFNESHHRSRMLEFSRDTDANFVIAIDADELMSANMVKNFDSVMALSEKYHVQHYWFNVVGGTLNKLRQDPLYKQNFRTFILPLKHTGKFDLSLWQYHTPRVPPVNLRRAHMNVSGFIHLQAINRKFYALKQLWYKHYEYVEYNKTIADINARYDPVVNKLNFEEIETPLDIIEGITFNSAVYDELATLKGYEDYIKENQVKELITFGEEYVL